MGDRPGRSATSQREACVDAFDLGWLMGVLEGEGSFACYGTPIIQVGMTDKDVVMRAAKLCGITKIRKQSRPFVKVIYSFTLTGENALWWMRKALPFMGKRRTIQIKDAMRKAAARPGFMRGEAIPWAKLTEIDVRAIRKSRQSQTALAKKYGVCQTSISGIQRRLTWKSVT